MTLFIKTIYAPVIYTAPCIIELAYRLVPTSQGPKISGITGPDPLPLPQVMYMHPSKTLCIGLYKSQVHRLFYAHTRALW
jgi:hypothetical protein